jgi:hypothetical protein
LTASAGYGRAQRLCVFVERLCLTASAGYGRAERLCEFVERLCLTASAGYGCAERLCEFVGRLCLTASAGCGRAEPLHEFLEVLDAFLRTLSLFLAPPRARRIASRRDPRGGGPGRWSSRARGGGSRSESGSEVGIRVRLHLPFAVAVVVKVEVGNRGRVIEVGVGVSMAALASLRINQPSVDTNGAFSKSQGVHCEFRTPSPSPSMAASNKAELRGSLYASIIGSHMHPSSGATRNPEESSLVSRSIC